MSVPCVTINFSLCGNYDIIDEFLKLNVSRSCQTHTRTRSESIPLLMSLRLNRIISQITSNLLFSCTFRILCLLSHINNALLRSRTLVFFRHFFPFLFTFLFLFPFRSFHFPLSFPFHSFIFLSSLSYPFISCPFLTLLIFQFNIYSRLAGFFIIFRKTRNGNLTFSEK